jgi:steroid 5-alpha reductase family enzyme
VIASPFVLVAIGVAAAALEMAALWAIQVRVRDASHVDAGWAYGIGALAVLYAALADGRSAHRVLVGVIGALWSLRLGTYLLVNRVIGKPEDGRYRELRTRWGARADARFFAFFQFQAALVVFFAIPFVVAAYNHAPRLAPLEWAGAAVWLAGVSGVSAADLQLARWRREPANRGRTCRAGLWRYSRHPNYFFEWVTWCGFALVALAAPWGWIALGVPAALLLLLFRVTGIPATEAQALRSRGDDYRSYQRETSVFVPLPRRRTARGAPG